MKIGKGRLRDDEVISNSVIPALLFNKKNLVGNMARKKLPPNNVIASCPGFSGIDGLIIILEEMKLNELVVNQVFLRYMD